MQKFTRLTAKVIPLPLKDVDTDMIIPAQFLTSTSQGGYGSHLFSRLKENDTNFVFNNPDFFDGKILVAGSNFGCGSSREHAVWALMEWGIKVVISSGFADIFFSNSPKNGLILVQLPEEIVSEITQAAESGNYKLTVDLEKQKIILPDSREFDFPFDNFRKECILKGIDDLGYILSYQEDLEKWNEKRKTKIFYDTLQANF